MAFGAKEASRNKSTPTNLFLFQGSEAPLESMIGNVVVGPGTGEFAYGTTRVTTEVSTDYDVTIGGIVNGTRTVTETIPINARSVRTGTDFQQSIQDLLATAPNIKTVTLAAAWFADDLRMGVCEISPRVASNSLVTSPDNWQVGTLTRAAAPLLTQEDGLSVYEGSPSDKSLYEAIVYVKSLGLRCALMPILLMDIPRDNTLPNLDGTTGQPHYPWRGQIGKPDAATNIQWQADTFFGTATPSIFSWNATQQRVAYASSSTGYAKFAYHMATLAKAAGANDFFIGSELAGVTALHNDNGDFPAVEWLRTIVEGCRSILGSSVNISYNADYTEYHTIMDGTTLRFRMDRLWSHADVDFVSLNAAMPLSDWRQNMTHLDWKAGYTSIHDRGYLQSNIEGGEGYDWEYTTAARRNSQTRTPIADAAYNKPWVFRPKDIRNWWANTHYNRASGTERTTPTDWVAKSKPVQLTDVGCGAINCGSNQPQKTVNAASSYGGPPYYSNSRPDAAILKAYAASVISYWTKNRVSGFINPDRIAIRGWDVRPYPLYPTRTDLYGDAAAWRTGHWLTGRIEAGKAFEYAEFGPYAFTDAEEPIVRAGITYQSWPVKMGDITSNATLDKAETTVTLARGSGFENEFVGYPPSSVVNLTIFQGQMDDVPSLVDYPAMWVGRVNTPQWDDNEIQVNCIPVSTSIKRPGLRRNYQVGCPHVLYGADCKASKAASTFSRSVTAIDGNTFTIGVALGDYRNYYGGLVEWVGSSGLRELRSIITATPTTVKVRGTLRGLAVGSTVAISRGCDHTEGAQGCALHKNILNYGGQPFFPDDNPLSSKNQFY